MKEMKFYYLYYFIIFIQFECHAIIRPNILSLSNEEWEIYIYAFETLKQNGIYDVFSDLHENVFFQVHQNLFFLPWHRKFISDFEQELGLPVPYWNSSDIYRRDQIWLRIGHLSSSLQNKCIDSGPFKEWKTSKKRTCLHRNPNEQIMYWENHQLNELIKDPVNFSTKVENGPHSTVHQHVGGNFGNSHASPDDPLFWFHHAFVDKIWWLHQLTFFNEYPVNFQLPLSNESIHDWLSVNYIYQ